MFGRLATVRTKTAEDAFADGRLEDAFEIALAEDLSGQPRIQRLRRDLAKAFLKRGQDRMLTRQFAAALADFDKAARCGNQRRKVEEWRRRAQAALQTERRDEEVLAEALAEARRRFNAGSLVGAAEALEKAPGDDPQRAKMAEAIERQSRRAETALTEARAALNEGDLSRAVERLRAARALHTKLDGIVETENKLVEQLVARAAESFKCGRLDRARQDLETLGDVGRDRRERIEIQEALSLATDAARAISDDRYARANVLLGRLAKLTPKAGWLSDTRQSLGRLEKERRGLLESPLALLLGQHVPSRLHDRTMSGTETLPAAPAPPPVQAQRSPPDQGVAPPVGARLPRQLLLRIDGVGSFLLLRGDRIGIGRTGPGATADLQLISDLAERQAEVVRAGEDYFVVSQTGVELAGRHVDHALLQDGDRIRLGKRMRLTFRRPSLKSSAAALDLGDGVRMATDCRRVILWSGPILLGGTRECHVRLGGRQGSYVLMERGGRLYLKRMGPGGEATPLVLSEQVAVGELRLSVSDGSHPAQAGGRIA